MKIRYIRTGRTVDVTAKAAPSETSYFPGLHLTINFEDGKTRELRIVSANWGLPGYYIYDETNGYCSIINGYLPGDYDEPMDLKALPEIVIKRLVRSYVLITLANIFSNFGWEYAEHTYNNKHLPDELQNAINNFVDLEYERILR